MRKSIAHLFAIVLAVLVLLPLAACDQAKEAAKGAADAAQEAAGEAMTGTEKEDEEATEEPSKGAAGEGEVECTDAMMHAGECMTEASKKEKKTPQWRDENDAGDDPMNPGCHWGYAAGTGCSQGKVFIQGDTCFSNKLREWYDTECHAQNADYNYYDCNEYCIENDMGTGGKCVPVANACGRGMDSARCQCFGMQP